MKPIKSKVGLRVLAGGLLWLLALGALTAQTKIGNLYYNLNETAKTAEVASGGTKYSGDIVIPASVTYSGTTYAVTTIGASAFSGCTGLKSVTIPNSVTEIDMSAFSGCTGLTSIEIPNSVTEIGVSAFSGCTGLTSIEIPNSVTEFGVSAFSGCTGLTSVTIPNSVTSIGERVFASCTSLTSIEIPNSVTEIGVSAFNGCTGLTSIEIPNSVAEIGVSAFSGCTGLTSIEIPNSVTEIGASTFAGCTGLTSIELPATLDSVGALAFNGCAGLTSVRIADRGTALKFYNATVSDITGIFGQSSVRMLYMGGDINYYTTYDEYGNDRKREEKSPFSGMQTLDTLCIGPSVTEIGCEAFSGCTGLKHVTIADRETALRLGGDEYDIRAVFKSCSIQSLYLGGDVGYASSPFENLTTLDTVTFGRLVTRITDGLFEGCTGLRVVQLPRRVTKIGWEAFRGCTGLTSIAIPNSVTSIGGSAFSGCTGLTEVAMPAVTYIGGSAFSGCTGLTEVAMPKVTKIGNEAFSGCTGLTSVAMPAVTEIGDYYNDKTGVFSGCTGLTEVAMPAVEKIGGSAFSGCTGLTEVAMPKVTKIGNEAFSGCTSLTEVAMPAVTEIGGSAFKGCTNLTSVAMPKMDYIPAFAFCGCTGLTEVAMPVAREIGDSAFSGCTGLTEVKMPNLGYNTTGIDVALGTGAFAGCTGLRSVAMMFWEYESRYERGAIGVGVFEGCTDLVSVQWETMKGGIRRVPARCFAGCTALEDIGPDGFWSGLWTIGDSAFMDCAALKELGLRQVQSLGKRAFQNCHGLHLLSVSDTLREIGIGVFDGCAALDTLILGQSLNFIAYDAFKGCTGLRSVTCRGAVPAVCEDGVAFTGVDKAACRLLVPQASVDAYGAAAEWRDFDLVGGDVHVAVASLTLPRDFFISIAFPYGNYRVLEASVAPVHASNPGLAWSTSNSRVAAIKRTNGYDVELGAGDLVGTAVITVRTTDGTNLSAECRVTVGHRATAIRITAYGSDETLSETELAYGDSLRLMADVGSATNRVVAWTSSAPDVLQVDSLGWVRTVGFGTATVTARTTDGSGLEATCALTVKEPVPVKTLEISTGGASPELYPGGTLQLSAVVTPADATNQTVTWSSSDTKVARVNQSGYVEAVAIGGAVITARTTDGSGLEATCTLTVKPVLAERIRISTNGKSTTLKVNATLQLSAIITPDNATSTAVTWSSSDAGVATVSTTGRVRAVAIGEAVVTARTTDGSDLSATCDIKVVEGAAVEVPEALQAVRVYAADGHIEVRGLPLGTAVTLSGVDGRLWYQTEAVTGPELTLSAPRGHVYVLRLNHTHSFKVYLP